MVLILEKMLKNKAKFAILAHDSAAQSLKKQAEKLAQLLLLQLSTLKSSQAYIMHNFKGKSF
jgi:hypothetical protein